MQTHTTYEFSKKRTGGRPKKGPNRTIDLGGVCMAIVLTKGKSTIINKADYLKVKNYRWVAHSHKGKTYAVAYNKAAKKYHGEFAYQNKLEEI